MKRSRLLVASSILQFALFVPVAVWARKHPHPPVELAMTHAFQRKRSSFLQKLVQGISGIVGSAVLLNILVLPTAFLLWRRNWRLEAILTMAISWLGVLVRVSVAQFIKRPRPSPTLVAMSDDKGTKSFPSGHVCSSVGFWGWLATISLIRGTTPWHKALAAFAALCLVIVGPSRVYLGDHWVTDVVGGYLFGGGWLALCVQLYLVLRTGDTTLLERADLL
ncbi:MAG TPA: phosphatase PAP2 family protein [Ktedonobacteraceae bacterium]|nr:phosphatase PAP2 family protein [Ktedonobacteraceae bacterium]